jgi:hypothetical protein
MNWLSLYFATNFKMANSNENSQAERDPEELFCLRWNDYQVILKIILKKTTAF